MNTVKDDISKKQGKASGNPFIKAVEDKKQITVAIQSGKSLSELKEIKFVKPV